MRKFSALFALTIIAGLAAPAVAATGKHRTHSSKPHVKHTSSSRFQPHQRSIDDARATEIQAALIKAGYLNGQPSGHWDQTSIAAMTKLQAENGWQTKLVPDSRALIKLGLGPSSAPEEPVSQVTTSSAVTASIGAPSSSAYAQ